MSRTYVEEPLGNGWGFVHNYTHKFRSPQFFEKATGRKVSCKLASESWLPGCEDFDTAEREYAALMVAWEKATGLPLLSTPSKTGQAFLWEQLPEGDFPSLEPDMANHIRKISPQHRMEVLRPEIDLNTCLEYDARWMYASCTLADRLPVGTPRKVTEFEPYMPGWYEVLFTVPATWRHVGLLPVATLDGKWIYPSTPGQMYSTWASEPELTVAHSMGWKIDVIEGVQFDKGRPLEKWTKKLIALQKALEGFEYAQKAVRAIHVQAIGSMHVNGYTREEFIPEKDWRDWVRNNRDLLSKVGTRWERVPGGRMVPVVVPDDSPLAIYMPHWSSQIYALERAWIAKHLLQCDFETVVKVHGDAILSTRALPFQDNGNMGQLRRKA
jgi:hypothetical protein